MTPEGEEQPIVSSETTIENQEITIEQPLEQPEEMEIEAWQQRTEQRLTNLEMTASNTLNLLTEMNERMSSTSALPTMESEPMEPEATNEIPVVEVELDDVADQKEPEPEPVSRRKGRRRKLARRG